jgi:REP element-mobilizing transposase RayT
VANPLHMVFPVKYRKALLDEEVTNIIKETAASIEERYPFEMEALGTDKNHIHVLCSAHPKVAPGLTVQMLKSLRVLPPGKFSEDGQPLNENCGVENFGQTVTMLPQWENGPTGKW